MFLSLGTEILDHINAQGCAGTTATELFRRDRRPIETVTVPTLQWRRGRDSRPSWDVSRQRISNPRSYGHFGTSPNFT